MEPVFRSILSELITATSRNATLSGGLCRASDGRICTVCRASRIDYNTEVGLKNAALQTFWDANVPHAINLSPIVPAPLGRRYRAISKRKVIVSPRGFSLSLIAPDEDGGRSPIQVLDCMIEPTEHTAIYRHVHAWLARPGTLPLLEALNYIIVKGNYREQTVILNVRSISGNIIKHANTLSRSLTRAEKSVQSVFLFEGEADDRYYLGLRRTGSTTNIRKLFGKERIFERVNGKSFLYNALAFSQVNPSMLDEFVGRIGRCLEMQGQETLYDLYCGYGLFGISYAASVRHVLGAEWAYGSVTDAVQNAERNGATNARFTRTDIDADSLAKLLDRAQPTDIAILDPPRNGTAPGVLETVAARRLRKVLHLFCNIDLLPAELKRWHQSGYLLVEAVPFDMFPGTDSVEILTALVPRDPRQ